MRILALALAASLLLGAPSPPPPDGLAALRDSLERVRAGHGTNTRRDAGPELTPVKQALRLWIEPQLPRSSTTGSPDPAELAAAAARINGALVAAGLACGNYRAPGYRCRAPSAAEENDRGYLGDVRMASLHDGRYLLLVTAVGVRCGFDESAYVYEAAVGGGWKLMLASEEDHYGEDDFSPQNFLAIDISPPQVAWNEAAPPPLVATLGYSPWCSSNWQVLTQRLWRASPSTPTPTPLIDRKDELFIGDYFVAAQSLGKDDLLVQFRGRSIDEGVLVRDHVLHYRIGDGDGVSRIAPVALSPRDFVDEWLTAPPADAARWQEAGAPAAALARVRAALPEAYGNFAKSRRCRSDPTLRQVAFTALGKTEAAPDVTRYFKVRWLPPYRFSLVDAGPKPFAGCDRDVDSADDPATLFPLEGWRG